MQLDGENRTGPDDLGGLMVRNRSGKLVSLNVATLTRAEGANSIRHYGLNRAIGHSRAGPWGEQRSGDPTAQGQW